MDYTEEQLTKRARAILSFPTLPWLRDMCLANGHLGSRLYYLSAGFFLVATVVAAQERFSDIRVFGGDDAQCYLKQAKLGRRSLQQEDTGAFFEKLNVLGAWSRESYHADATGEGWVLCIHVVAAAGAEHAFSMAWPQFHPDSCYLAIVAEYADFFDFPDMRMQHDPHPEDIEPFVLR